MSWSRIDDGTAAENTIRNLGLNNVRDTTFLQGLVDGSLGAMHGRQ